MLPQDNLPTHTHTHIHKHASTHMRMHTYRGAHTHTTLHMRTETNIHHYDVNEQHILSLSLKHTNTHKCLHFLVHDKPAGSPWQHTKPFTNTTLTHPRYTPALSTSPKLNGINACDKPSRRTYVHMADSTPVTQPTVSTQGPAARHQHKVLRHTQAGARVWWWRQGGGGGGGGGDGGGVEQESMGAGGGGGGGDREYCWTTV